MRILKHWPGRIHQPALSLARLPLTFGKQQLRAISYFTQPPIVCRCFQVAASSLHKQRMSACSQITIEPGYHAYDISSSLISNQQILIYTNATRHISLLTRSSTISCPAPNRPVACVAPLSLRLLRANQNKTGARKKVPLIASGSCRYSRGNK